MSIEEAAKILGVSVNESIDAVKAKYRKLARYHHPDKQAADLKEIGEAKLKEVNLAFEVFEKRVDEPKANPNSNYANPHSYAPESYSPNYDDDFDDDELDDDDDELDDDDDELDDDDDELDDDDDELDDDVASLEINQFWRDVESVPRPPSVFNRVNQTPHVTIAGSPLPPSALVEQRPSIQRSVVQSIAGWIAVIAFMLIFSSSARLFGINLFVTFGIWWCVCEWMATKQFETNNQPWLNTRNALIKEHALRESLVRDLRHQFQYVEQQIPNSIAENAKRFDDCLSRLEADKSNFHALDFAYRNERDRIQSVKYGLQLERFLDNYYVRNFKLDGIGPQRLAQLELRGIATAADIDAARLIEIPGFGIGLIETLLLFRSVVAEQFRFDPSAPLPASVKASLNGKLAARRSLEVRLQTGLSNLRAASLEGKQRMEASKVQIQSLLSRLAQAEANAGVSLHALNSADAIRIGNPLSQNAVVISRLLFDVGWSLAQRTKNVFSGLLKP